MTDDNTIDLVITSSDMTNYWVSLEIDDERKPVITKLTKCKYKLTKVESDHNVFITKFKLNWYSSKQHESNKMKNMKNM